MAITAPARLIDSWDIVRLKAVTLSLPNIIALRLTSIAPNVLTFIPPAVDCGAPPENWLKYLNAQTESGKCVSSFKKPEHKNAYTEYNHRGI